MSLRNLAACPRLAAVLSRSQDESITSDELESVQLELESLLITSIQRTRNLRLSGNSVATGTAEPPKINPKSPVKKRIQEESPLPKKPKEQQAGISTPVSPAPPVNKIKTQPPNSPISEDEPVEEELVLPQLDLVRQPNPKQDFPNKFWASIEPYCAPLDEDDLKMLDDMVASYKDDEELCSSIPPLGRHYSLRWAEEDLQQEQKESAHLGAKRKEEELKAGSEAERIIKKAKEEEPVSTFGPLTQRLVGALLEENIVTSLQGGEALEPAAEGSAALTPQEAASLERNVRKELEELGILNADEPDEIQADDQIVLEIRRCQGELRALSAHNMLQLKKLQRLGRNQMQIQVLKDKLKEADNEVLEHHRRFFALRQKKKEPSRKERENALQAIKAREEILRHLDSLDS